MNDDKIVSVGFGKHEVSREPNVILTAFGLGSCVAVSFYDPVEKLAGMIHVALPVSPKPDDPSPTKYADTGIPILLNDMEKQGADKKRFVVKVVGGAQILKLNLGLASLEIGERNIKSVKETLKMLGLRINAEEIGGERGRTYKVHVSTGKSIIKTANSEHEI